MGLEGEKPGEVAPMFGELGEYPAFLPAPAANGLDTNPGDVGA